MTPGSGATVAADDIGGVLYQRVKPTLGADGSAADALGGAWPFATLSDPGGATAKAYGLDATDNHGFFAIDAAGIVRWSYAGPAPLDLKWLPAVAAALGVP